MASSSSSSARPQRKRNVTDRYGTFADSAATSTIVSQADENTNDTAYDDNDNEDTKTNDSNDSNDSNDDDAKRPTVKRARRSPAPPTPLAAAVDARNHDEAATAKELVAEFIAIPDKFNDDILAPLRESFGEHQLPGYASALYDEIVQHGKQLRSTRDDLYSLVAIGVHGSGKSWQLNELANAAVLPSADCADSVTTTVIRLRHTKSAAAPVVPPPPVRTFTVVLRLPTTVELANRLIAASGKLRDHKPRDHREVIPNPFASYDASQMAELALDPQHFAMVFEAVRAGASVLVSNAGVGAQANHNAIAQDALQQLRALAGPAAMRVDEQGASALDQCDSVIVGSFTREHADRAVQRTIELLCGVVGALAAPLLYVIDVTSDSFAFAHDFQLIDLPGVDDIKEWPHLHKLAREIAATSSWLVVPHGSRYPAVASLVDFLSMLIADKKDDVLPEIPALVFSMEVLSVADRQVYRSFLLLRASEAVSRFNAERSKSGSVDHHSAMFEDSVQILDRFPSKPMQRLPDAENGTFEVYDRLRWLRTQRTLSLMQMKVVNLCSVVRVLAQQRRTAPDSAVAKLGNIRSYCKTMAKHMVGAWSRAANATIDAASKKLRADSFEHVAQEALSKAAEEFWRRETDVLKGNVRMLCNRPNAKIKPTYVRRTDATVADDDDDDDGADDDAVSALLVFVGEFCERRVFDFVAWVHEAKAMSGDGGGDDGDSDSDSDDGDSDSDSDDNAYDKAAALSFAECVGDAMEKWVVELGDVLCQLGNDQVAVSQETRKQLIAKIDEVIKPSTDKMRRYWNATTEKLHKLRQVEAERVYVKRLPRDMDVLPIISQATDWTRDVEQSRKGVKVLDGGGAGAVLDSQMMSDELKLDDGSSSAIAPVIIRCSGADNRFVAELSAPARECVRKYVYGLRPCAENDAFLVQSAALPWIPPVFVPVTEDATAHNGARPMQRTRRGKLQEQDVVTHLTVLIVRLNEWQTVAKKLADASDGATLLMILPECAVQLHPWAHEFALAFTRDVISQLVGCYVDFCLLPSVFGEFCELNAALTQLRPVSTAFGLHYMQNVAGDWRKHWALRLKSCDDDAEFSRLNDVLCDLGESAPVEPPVSVVSIDVSNSQTPPPGKGPLDDAMRKTTRLAQLFTMATTKHSIVAALRISARLDELAKMSIVHAKNDLVQEAHKLFDKLFGGILSNAIGVWGVKTPHASYCWSTFRMRGNALVHVQAGSSGVVPILFSTLSVRRFSFFGVSNAIRDKPDVTYELSLNSMARRLYESGRRNVLLKLIAWRQDPKLTADQCA